VDKEHQDRDDLIKSVMIANEFIKVIHGYAKERARDDGLPQDLAEDLANDYLNNLMEDNNIEPEMLIWGLMKIIEILLVSADLEPTDLSANLDNFIAYLKERNAQ
jgi:hypothetical protein